MRTSTSRFLEVWVDGRFDGSCKLPVESVAARAVLKFFPASKHAEFRDPVNHEIYRYDQSKNAVCPIVA
jgi:hypothetical protein